MNYKSSDLAIIIPSKNYQNIKICLKSIKNQTKKPGQTIVVFDKKKKFKNIKNVLFSYTKFSNQVFQRTHGLSLLNKKIKLILQLDDKFYLHEKAIENLVKEWNESEKDVAGIGIKSNFFYENVNKYRLLKFITLTGTNKPGKVLISGFNNKLISKKKLIDVDWLQGGLSSWKLKNVPSIFNRKFPIIKWSILEDLIFSYDIKFNKKFKLKMTNSLKAYVIKNKKNNIKINDFYLRGFEYAKMQKIFVYTNHLTLSKIAYYYSYISSSCLGIIWTLFKFDKKIFFYFGRLAGMLADIKKIRVL